MTIAVVLMNDLPAPSADAGFGALSTERGCMPLRALDVNARLDGLLAEVDVRQTFVNAFDEPIEATYVFPLPDRAAVRGFRMEVAGRVIDGILKERGQARREYDDAIKAGHRAGIAEEERPDVFTLRVGNLMPGDVAIVQLTLVGPLEFDDGEATFRFPLVVAPRYIPGTPLPGPSVGDGVEADTDAVPDASRIAPPVWLPGFASPVRLSLTVDLPGRTLPEGGFRSSLHALVSEPAEGGWRLRVQPGERLDRDFILRYRLAGDAVRTSFTVTPDATGNEGTFALTLLPPAGLASASRPRDVVFVLDRSGSMQGWKMVAARRALGRLIDVLTPRDRFTVYAFDDCLETPPLAREGKLMAATDRNRFRTIEFLAKVESRGGTEMARPLGQAVKALGDATRDRVLVLVTDGQVGNEDQILKSLGARLSGIRIFTLGIDQAVNAGFLRRLAIAGGGSFDAVESEDRLDDVMDKIQRRIGPPVLTGLTVNGDGIDASSLTPARLPDVFAGSPLTILGRYKGQLDQVCLAARDAAGRDWLSDLPSEPASHRAATAVWARGMVRALEDRYAIGERHPAAAKRIVDTSLRFGVLSRFTAFVAVDRSAVVNTGGKQHGVVQPVEMPAGWEMWRAPGSVAGAASPMPRYSKGMRGLQEDMPFLADDDLACSLADSGEVEGLMESLPPPSASAPPSPIRKLRQRVSSIFAGKPAKNAQRDTVPVDLGAYRRQVEELLVALRANPDRRLALGILTTRLAALCEDLLSIGAAATDVEPLDKLLTLLRSLNDGPIDEAFAEAQSVLSQFAGERAAAFWK